MKATLGPATKLSEGVQRLPLTIELPAEASAAGAAPLNGEVAIDTGLTEPRQLIIHIKRAEP